MESKFPTPSSGQVGGVDPIGGGWLVSRFELELVQPLYVRSEIGPRRNTVRDNSHRREIYQEQMRPAASVVSHLTFMLKHEDVHLEMLARLCDQVDPAELATWARAEPTGQYARRACFFYEWLTGRRLDVEDGFMGGNYVPALDPDEVLVATQVRQNARWRVRDNLPGTPAFCPTVRLTAQVKKALEFDLADALRKEEIEFGADVLRRSAVWMTLRESRSSFQIEGEQDQVTRVQRFAAVIEARTGVGEAPLSGNALATLQRDILGDETTLPSFGLRRSPVFVGQVVRYENVVHYVAPHWESVEGMLDGLREFAKRTPGAPAIARAAVASFAFVYIHPLADGNGRVHRFLINDVLRRDGAIHDPFIVPVSALITGHAIERARYDEALEVFSKALMARYSGQYTFSSDQEVQPDGISSNFRFNAYDQAQYAWRFLDLTSHVAYAAGLLERTVHQEMHAQARFYRSLFEARAAVKEIIEGPDPDIDAIIRSVRENKGVLSGKLASRFPVLQKSSIWPRVVTAVEEAFGDDEQNDKNAEASPPASAG